ncbi:MAG: hypothetical protein OSJ58_07785 [Dysosmobacter sp.]|nr:hypothetical protein [Dysosmobacter sp.]
MFVKRYYLKNEKYFSKGEKAGAAGKVRAIAGPGRSALGDGLLGRAPCIGGFSGTGLNPGAKTGKEFPVLRQAGGLHCEPWGGTARPVIRGAAGGFSAGRRAVFNRPLREPDP